MIEFFKKLFGVKPAEVAVPYKVETPKLPAVATPAEKPASKKKPAVKKATTRKPKTPKA